MDRHVPYQVLNLWTSAQGVRHITHVDGSARQVDEVLDRVRRVNAHHDAAKTRTLVLPGGGASKSSVGCMPVSVPPLVGGSSTPNWN